MKTERENSYFIHNTKRKAYKIYNSKNEDYDEFNKSKHYLRFTSTLQNNIFNLNIKLTITTSKTIMEMIINEITIIQEQKINCSSYSLK